MAWTNDLVAPSSDWDGLLDGFAPANRLSTLSEHPEQLDPIDDWMMPDLETEVTTDVLQRELNLLVDLLESRRIVWPGIRNGITAIPPISHLVDHLVRKYVETSVISAINVRFAKVPSAATIAAVPVLPDCDLCDHRRAARYDAPVVGRLSAFLCPPCYRLESSEPLGLGLGQFLIENGEVPHHVIERTEHCLDVWERRGAKVFRSAFESDFRQLVRGSGRAEFPLDSWHFQTSTEKAELERLFDCVYRSCRFERGDLLAYPRKMVDRPGSHAVRLSTGQVVAVVRHDTFKIEFDGRGKSYLAQLHAKLSPRMNGTVDVELEVLRAVVRVHFERAKPSKVIQHLAQMRTGRHEIWTSAVPNVRWVGPSIRVPGSSAIGSLSVAFLRDREALCAEHEAVEAIDAGLVLSWSDDFFGMLEELESTGSDSPDNDRTHRLVFALAVPENGRSRLAYVQRYQTMLGAMYADLDPGLREAFRWSLIEQHTLLDAYVANRSRFTDESFEDNRDVEEATWLTIRSDDGSGWRCLRASLAASTEPQDSAFGQAAWHLYQSAMRREAELALLHAVIGMESLLMQRRETTGSEGRESIRQILAKRIVQLTQDERDRRLSLDLYDCRSDIAHSGATSRFTVGLPDLSHRGTELLCRVMRAASSGWPGISAA